MPETINLRQYTRWLGSVLILAGILLVRAGAQTTSLTPEPSATPAAVASATPDTRTTPPGETAVPRLVTAANVSDGIYRLGPGDVIDVLVAKNPLMSRDNVHINNAGQILLPLIPQEIQAACRTEKELAQAIAAQYRHYLHNPQVFVALREINAQPVAVIGSVNAPGRFQLQRPVRLLELLTFVNGPSPTAGRTIQVIHNPQLAHCAMPADLEAATAPENEVVVYELEKTLQAQEDSNPFAQAGDIIRLIEAEQVQAYVIGNVRTPLAVNLRDPVTLTEALARAGGVLPESNLEKVIISRQTPKTRQKTQIIVNLKAINRHQQDDILLQPNDIIEVPGASGGKKFLRDLFTGLVPSATRILPVQVIR